MDANKVLENTLSPDATLRAEAEKQLIQASESNFPGYLVILAQALANEQAPPTVRSAAGIALKNSFSFRDFTLLQKVQLKWIQEVDADTRKEVKRLALETLRSRDSRAGQSAGQFIASIAAIELPRDEWQELMPQLVEYVSGGSDALKIASLVTIGYICETENMHLRQALQKHSNSILTAVVQGARKEEANLDVRFAGVTALSDSIEFVRSNFDNEGERNYIMQVVCEATQAGEARIQAGAFGCLNRIVAMYYDKMKFYMEKALYGLSISGMRSDDEDVAKLALEFWCTVCEEELAIEDDNVAAPDDMQRQNFYFARVAVPEVLPSLLQLLLNQDEDAADEEYNVHRAAYMCLSLFANCVGNETVGIVAGFMEQNLRHAEWQHRDAAVSAFGAILDGPHEGVLLPLISMAMPLLMETAQDPELHVRDSTAYALGRVCEFMPRAINEQTQLPALIETLFHGLNSNPRMAQSCCWALQNIAENFSGEPGGPTNPLSPAFQASVSALLAVTEKPDGNMQVRTAAYEVLNQFVTASASDSLRVVATLSDVILQRIQGTMQMQSQVVSIEDKMTLEEMQTSLLACLQSIILRLDREVLPQADRVMETVIALLQSINGKSLVPEAVFAVVGTLANALGADMDKYMQAFVPFLHAGLGNHDEPTTVAMAIGLCSDLLRALDAKGQPYCDGLMNYLLEALRSNVLGNQCKPAILQCFFDIANSTGPAFETYLVTVANVLQQAANVQVNQETSFDMLGYVISLREGIVDAWSGAVIALKGSNPDALRPFIDAIFHLLNTIAQDGNRSDGLMRASMGILGDLADTFPNGEYTQYFRAEWVIAFIKDARLLQEYSTRTHETAKWAKEQIKRQPNGTMS